MRAETNDTYAGAAPETPLQGIIGVFRFAQYPLITLHTLWRLI